MKISPMKNLALISTLVILASCATAPTPAPDSTRATQELSPAKQERLKALEFAYKNGTINWLQYASAKREILSGN